MSFSLRPALFALVACAMAAPVAAQRVDSGAYLAARAASGHSDYAAASRYYSQALTRDPDNIGLMDNAITAYIGLGQFDSAAAISQRVLDLGVAGQVANLVNTAAFAQDSKWEALLDLYANPQTVGPLFDGLARAWGLVGQGKGEEALTEFDTVSATDGIYAFGQYHKALALGALGRFEEAAAILGSQQNGGLRLTRRGVVAHAQILSQIGRNDEALSELEVNFGGELDTALQILATDLAAGKTVPFDTIRSPQDGLAEVYHSIANALNGEATDNYTLIYSRLSEYLRPDHIEGKLLSASLLMGVDQFDLAIDTFAQIPRDSTASQAAELGRAEALRASGRPDAAIEVVRQMVDRYPDDANFRVSLGDALRQQERFEEARQAYDGAIELMASEARPNWAVYFTRGIANERTDRWPEAEADFLRALELNPDQPQVLNYLGYSYVELRQNLDEALDMIERAVAARPDSGAITDSLGWVLYRLGRYDEAVAPMERAVELMPVDPVINDHLGDVYWAVGRYREAEFQWKRALSFVEHDQSDEVDPDRIRRKLEVGLYQVLDEEGATPLHVANDG